MSSPLHISEVEALDRMRDALRSFRSRVEDGIARAEAAAARTLDRLGDAIIKLRTRVEALEQEKNRAWSAMTACHEAQRAAANADREPPDCTPYDHAYMEAALEHARAQSLLDGANAQYDLVERQTDEFRREARHCADALEDAVAGGGETLARTAERARAVHTGRMGGFGRAGAWWSPRAPAAGDVAARVGRPAAESVEGRWRWTP